MDKRDIAIELIEMAKWENRVIIRDVRKSLEIYQEIADFPIWDLILDIIGYPQDNTDHIPYWADDKDSFCRDAAYDLIIDGNLTPEQTLITLEEWMEEWKDREFPAKVNNYQVAKRHIYQLWEVPEGTI